MRPFVTPDRPREIQSGGEQGRSLALQERRIRRQTKHELADQFEMRLAAMNMLGDHMHVAESSLEGLEAKTAVVPAA